MTTNPTAPRAPRGVAAGPRPILQVADDLGLRADEVELHGRLKAKVRLSALDRLADAPLGRLVLVTAMTPTPLGEGKTTTAIGLADGLARLGLRAIVTLRQPTLGPVFGVKGGASGAGRAQLVPSQDVNLHLTGDAYAVGAAHNLAAAVLDNHLHHGNALGIDPATISWPRVTDHNDRALRRARIAIGDPHGERDATWEITVGVRGDGHPRPLLEPARPAAPPGADRRGAPRRRPPGRPSTTCGWRGRWPRCSRDALQPNLLQTGEGTPAFVHAGPFANIAHGNSSILADPLALRLADVVVTEAGFAADLGAEKFFDIKCRVAGAAPVGRGRGGHHPRPRAAR